MRTGDRVKQCIGTSENVAVPEYWRYGVVTESMGPYASVRVFAEDQAIGRITTEILSSPYSVVVRDDELKPIGA